jgi:hypothetical protein
MSAYPHEYPSPINGGAIVPEDWNEMVRQVKGFTPTGTFIPSYDYLVTEQLVDAILYCYAVDAKSILFGGPDDIGGVSGLDSAAVLNAVLATEDLLGLGPEVYIKGQINCDSVVEANLGGTALFSNGKGKLTFSGTHGLSLWGSSQLINLTIENVVTGSYPHTHIGVTVPGTYANPTGNVVLENVALNGWANALDINFLWSSSFIHVDTEYSYTGLTATGQCANNFFTNCLFQNIAQTVPTVIIQKDIATGAQPESNNFDNCLIYGGTDAMQQSYAAYTQVGNGSVIDGFSGWGATLDHCAEALFEAAYIGHPSGNIGGVSMATSINNRVINCDFDIDSGTGILTSGVSTGNIFNGNRIHATTGIQETDANSDYNLVDGNNIQGYTALQAIILNGANSKTGTNIPTVTYP